MTILHRLTLLKLGSFYKYFNPFINYSQIVVGYSVLSYFTFESLVILFIKLGKILKFNSKQSFILK